MIVEHWDIVMLVAIVLFGFNLGWEARKLLE